MPDEDLSMDAALERAGLDPNTAEAKTAAEGAEGSETPEGDPPAATPEGEGAETVETTEEQPEPEAAPVAAAPPTEDERIAAIVTATLVKAGLVKPAAAPAPAPAAAPAPAPEVKPPDYIARLLASDDPGVRADAESMFEDWKETRRELAEVRDRVDSREDDELAAGLAAELNDLVEQYTNGVDDKGAPVDLDPAAVDEKIAAFAHDPKTGDLCAALGAQGGMSAVFRFLYPDAVKKAKTAATPAGGGPGPKAPSTPVRKVSGSPRLQPGVHARGGGSVVTRPTPKPSAPPKDESMSEAMDRAFREQPQLANSTG